MGLTYHLNKIGTTTLLLDFKIRTAFVKDIATVINNVL